MAIIPDIVYERSLIPGKCRYILGIDEVGRGPWAGPVSVGAFLLDLDNFDSDFFVKNIRDSKVLTAQKRDLVFAEIQKRQYFYKVVSASAEEIDILGIQQAIYRCIGEVASLFGQSFDYVIVDGNMKLELAFPYRSIVKADLNCFSVAAASICAKVIRDKQMDSFSQIYPGYDFENNKGYGTAAHIAGLKKLGPCLIHRRSYQPIKNYCSSAK